MVSSSRKSKVPRKTAVLLPQVQGSGGPGRKATFPRGDGDTSEEEEESASRSKEEDSRLTTEESDPLESDEPLDELDLLIDGEEQPEYLNQLAILGPGASFGEIALLTYKPRMATIKCLQKCHFMTLSKSAYNKSLAQIEWRKMTEKINFIKELPLFSKLTRTYLSKFTYAI